MKKIRGIGLMGLALVLGCKSPSSAAQTETATAKEEIKKVQLNPTTDVSKTGDTYQLDSLKLNKTILSAFVSYSGGCKEHSFEALSTGLYAKSLPPKLTIALQHTANGDACKKRVMQELKFDISTVINANYKEAVIVVQNKTVKCSSK